MASPLGNKNNLKWTFEAAQEFFNDLLETVEDDQKCSSMAVATTKLGYYETLIQYLKDKFKEIDFEPIKKAEDIIKSRLIEKGLIGEYNPTMAIFILKNNHNMKDKTDITSGGDKIQPAKGIDLTNATPEELEVIAKLTGIKKED